MSETSTESWDGLLTNYLKADNVKDETVPYICIGVKVKDKDMDLELEQNGKRLLFSLNVTNKVFLKENGISKPKEVIGKKIFFRKVKATNPQTKKEVDSLRIDKLE